MQKLTKAEIDEAMKIHCIDARTRIFSAAFDKLDEQVFEHTVSYRPSHIAVSLVRGLSLAETLALIAQQNQIELDDAEIEERASGEPA